MEVFTLLIILISLKLQDNMPDFTQQINDFTGTNGTYNYQFDEVGNVILNSSSSIFQQHYVALPTVNFEYDNTKILSFYNVNFTEFIPTTVTSSVILSQNIIDTVNSLTEKNKSLESQLNSFVSTNEFISASADQQQIKDIILNLRVQLGQGTSSADFGSTFPYFPIPLENQNL